MNRLKKGVKLLFNNPKEFLIALNAFGIYNWIPDKLYLKIIYRLHFREKLNLKTPKSFNEKLQWLKLYDRNPKYCNLADKYLVREFVKETIGEQYLVPLIAVYDNADEINWDNLPSKFVLKCNHASGRNIICNNKKYLNIIKAKNELNKWINQNFFWHGREWVYKNIKPRIVAEKLLGQNGEILLDYKFMCFNGEPKCMFVCSERYSDDGLKVDFYDMNWNHMPFERQYKNSKNTLLKPKGFDKMVELSRTLSNEIPFVRVDFYDIDGKIYFGELTFFPGNGMEEFTPKYYDELLGSWIELPHKLIL